MDDYSYVYAEELDYWYEEVLCNYSEEDAAEVFDD